MPIPTPNDPQDLPPLPAPDPRNKPTAQTTAQTTGEDPGPWELVRPGIERSRSTGRLRTRLNTDGTPK